VPLLSKANAGISEEIINGVQKTGNSFFERAPLDPHLPSLDRRQESIIIYLVINIFGFWHF